ncbi:MAG: FAD-binding oxidoreductase, partial [Acidimicrobiales bacterium]
MTGVLCGSATSLAAALQPLRSAVGGTPTYDFVGPEGYMDAMLIEAGCQGSTVAACHLPTQDPAGTLSRSTFAAKSAYLGAPMPDAGTAAVVDAVEALAQQAPQAGGGFVFDSYGGAINRMPAAATAFVHRHQLAGVQYSVTWSSGAPGSMPAVATAWLSQS